MEESETQSDSFSVRICAAHGSSQKRSSLETILLRVCKIGERRNFFLKTGSYSGRPAFRGGLDAVIITLSYTTPTRRSITSGGWSGPPLPDLQQQHDFKMVPARLPERPQSNCPWTFSRRWATQARPFVEAELVLRPTAELDDGPRFSIAVYELMSRCLFGVSRLTFVGRWSDIRGRGDERAL